jgi:hypothetical protein
MNHQKPPLSKVEAISESHDVSRFDCGDHESLNDWLKRFALTNQTFRVFGESPVCSLSRCDFEDCSETGAAV